MGKLAKPQRSKKHKKIKAVGEPFNAGSRKDGQGRELNQKPRDYNQEIPRKLRNLGFTIEEVRIGKVGKRSKNKFRKHPDGPDLSQGNLSRTHSSSASLSEAGAVSHTPRKQKHNADKNRKDRKDKGQIKSKISDQVFDDYVDNLQPVRPFVDPFNFRKKQNETEKQFNRRVDNCANRALTKSKIDDHFDLSDEKKMMQKMTQLKKGMSDKKKQRLKEKKLRKVEALKEKKLEKIKGFDAFQDKVEFGETVHAPPTLTVRPKKAIISEDVDRPGRRMPELQAMIAANVQASKEQHSQISRKLGRSLKRKNLTMNQKNQADSKREMVIEAYRQMKRKLKH
ncbi:coiled-coil domain-containing protein 137-like isoform x2 [Plakobranchus ocellatus]|uniref:Coiled-coil domain-containing protein 137-like isoform x2 n=1 Tax=Plakobranchus ocellatus TaxID=259542 RepID=A0AAV4D570_9GAST|nr:coiled-coil domain-containing protein 137-like isoform x2 [Plakobranchus ocellatus]